MNEIVSIISLQFRHDSLKVLLEALHRLHVLRAPTYRLHGLVKAARGGAFRASLSGSEERSSVVGTILP